MATTNRARAVGGLLPGPPGAPVVASFPPSGATISVGRDSWVGEVMYNVVGLEQETAAVEQTNAAVVSDVSKPPQPVIRNDVRGTGDHVGVPGGVKCLADRIREKKRLFHSNRSLELKNLPDGVTEQDIRAAFPDLSLTSIIVERNDGRYRAGAKLKLAQPELLDDWPKSRENVFVKNKEVSVCVGSSDQWVCVARLPLDLTEEQFLSLVAAYGKVGAAFLMVSERSGTSKGYGLVKYYSNEAAAQARHLLDGREIRGFDIQADWLNSTHISFRSLHSKCLYVDHLPQNYRDMTGYRNTFSVITKPPYCQIALRNGVIQDWGLVEFFDNGEAELTQEKLNGHSLAPGNRIRVHYCIPGVNAINIYMKVVNAPADTKKKALLEDTPSSSVYSQLQKLASQNPVFAQNLQNIIQTQIQTIQTGVSPDDTRGSPLPVSPLPTEISPPQSNHNTQQQQHQIDSNAQAALMILLTAQRQAQTGEASLLHNPEVVNVLQSLVCQEQAEVVQDPYAQIMNIPGITVALGQHPNQHAGMGNTGLGNWPSQQSNERQQIQPKPHIVTTSSAGPTSKSPPPIIANNLNLLSNTQSLSQLLGVISHPESEKTPPPQPPPQSSASLSTTSIPHMTQTSSYSAVNMRHSAPQARPSLLGDRPPIPSTGQPPRHPPPSVHAQQMQMLQAQQAGQQQLLQAQLQAASQMQLSQQLASAHYYSNLYPGIQQQQPGGYLLSSIPGLHVTGPPQVGPFLVPQAVPQQLGGMQLHQQSQILNSMGIQQQSLLASHPLAIQDHNSPYTTSSFTIIPPITSPMVSPVSRVPSPGGSSTSFLSPTGSIGGGGLKRKASIPPSPEQSPQGPYIGQHSQGLGGHYADSYWQKKRLKQN